MGVEGLEATLPPMPAATGLGLASSGAWRSPPGVARGPVGVALLREWGAGPGMTRHPRWTHRATTPTRGRCGLGPAYVWEAVLPKVRLAPCDPLATRCPSVALGGLRAARTSTCLGGGQPGMEPVPPSPPPQLRERYPQHTAGGFVWVKRTWGGDE